MFMRLSIIRQVLFMCRVDKQNDIDNTHITRLRMCCEHRIHRISRRRIVQERTLVC